jgi:hypothetical protein
VGTNEVDPQASPQPSADVNNSMPYPGRSFSLSVCFCSVATNTPIAAEKKWSLRATVPLSMFGLALISKLAQCKIKLFQDQLSQLQSKVRQSNASCDRRVEVRAPSYKPYAISFSVLATKISPLLYKGGIESEYLKLVWFGNIVM